MSTYVLCMCTCPSKCLILWTCTWLCQYWLDGSIYYTHHHRLYTHTSTQTCTHTYMYTHFYYVHPCRMVLIHVHTGSPLPPSCPRTNADVSHYHASSSEAGVSGFGEGGLVCQVSPCDISVLQCVAVWCSVVQRGAVCCSAVKWARLLSVFILYGCLHVIWVSPYYMIASI